MVGNVHTDMQKKHKRRTENPAWPSLNFHPSLQSHVLATSNRRPCAAFEFPTTMKIIGVQSQITWLGFVQLAGKE